MPDNISGMSDSELLAMAQNLHSTIQTLPTQFGLTAGHFFLRKPARQQGRYIQLVSHIALTYVRACAFFWVCGAHGDIGSYMWSETEHVDRIGP